MYYYARKFEILKFELVKMAEIYALEFVMFFVILGLQELFPYSQLKLLASILYLVLPYILE